MSLATCVNERVVHVCALQRSGHHPVIQWMLINSGVPTCFLNDCTPQSNPYLTANLSCSLLPGLDLASERAGQWARKTLLLCSYEDQDLERVYPSSFDDTMRRWIGSAANVTNILILRDPFNLIASKYRWVVHGTQWQPTMDSLLALPTLWKTYAKEFLGLTSHVPRPVVRISYNQWFVDAAYRRTLAKTLGLSLADEGRDMIARWGPNLWGDSIDNLTYDGRATEMKVLERWRHFAHDARYRSLVSDPELIELSTAIFGPIAGTACFRP
jgi:hypothetical protein